MMLHLVVFALAAVSSALNNGFTRPPMGWSALYGAPFSTVNETIVREAALGLAQGGWVEAGYHYVTLDDWSVMRRKERQGHVRRKETGWIRSRPRACDELLKRPRTCDPTLPTTTTRPATIRYAERGPDGRLQGIPSKFPAGIRATSDFVHSLGLRFGVYV
jgi:hypothetical protein